MRGKVKKKTPHQSAGGQLLPREKPKTAYAHKPPTLKITPKK
jgi:hypothetical protein